MPRISEGEIIGYPFTSFQICQWMRGPGEGLSKKIVEQFLTGDQHSVGSTAGLGPTLPRVVFERTLRQCYLFLFLILTDSSCASQLILTYFSLRNWSVDIYVITFQSLWASCECDNFKIIFLHGTYWFEEAQRGRYWYTKALKKLNRNWSICAGRWGWCPQWVEGFRYGAGPAPSTIVYRWGRWEREGFVDVGCLPLEWGALLGVEDSFNIFCIVFQI